MARPQWSAIKAFNTKNSRLIWEIFFEEGSELSSSSREIDQETVLSKPSFVAPMHYSAQDSRQDP
jgi:hypothetical protein